MARTALLALALVAAAPGLGGAAHAKGKGTESAPDPAQITNVLLAPELAQWLVGPIFHMATPEERAEYLALASDEAARELIERFWERRGPHRRFPPAGTRFVFEDRVAEADVLYREGHHVGRRTDRGTVYVLYGPPADIRFEAAPRPGGEPIELWTYPDDAPPGLDGQPPRNLYAFQKQGNVTRLVNVPVRRRLPSGERPMAAGPPAVEVMSPVPGDRLTAGGTVWIEWRSDAPLEQRGIEEWEAFLSLDGGRYFGVRLTPHLDLGIRRFPVVLPGLAAEEARFLLRFGDERIEWEVEVPGTFRLVAGPLPLRWPALAAGKGEAARPGEPGVALWIEGRRSGADLRVERAAPAGGVRGTAPRWSGGAAAPLAASTPPPAPEPEAPPRRAVREAVPGAAAAVTGSPRPFGRDTRSLTQRRNE